MSKSQNNCHFLMRSMNKHKFYAIHVDQKHYIIVWKATVHWNSSLSTHCIVNDSQNHDPRIIKIKSVHQQPTTFQYHYYACLTILSAVTLALTFRQFCNFGRSLKTNFNSWLLSLSQGNFRHGIFLYWIKITFEKKNGKEKSLSLLYQKWMWSDACDMEWLFTIVIKKAIQ